MPLADFPPTSDREAIARDVGSRVRDTRKTRGLSQQQLAGLLGLTQATISAWESGRRSPGVDDLVGLGAVLEVPVGELFVGTQAPLAPEPDPSVRRERRALLRAETAGAALDYLADEIDDFAAQLDAVVAPMPVFAAGKASTPRGVATKLLTQRGVVEPPIRLEPLARACGVRVKSWAFAGDVSGILLDLEGGPVIGYNADHPYNRRRFTIAHELGHYLLNHHEHFHIDLRAPVSSQTEPPGFDYAVERKANQFAAELLMPPGMVRAQHKQTHDVNQLATVFEVSREAMGFRLVNLGLSG